MSEIGANDARTHLIELLERAEHGEESTISTEGDPTARISPVMPAHDPEESVPHSHAFASALKRWGIKATPQEIKSWIEEGRP